jgi:hypothetical protein
MKTVRSQSTMPKARRMFLLIMRISPVLLAAALLVGCSKKNSGRFQPLMSYMQQVDILTGNYLHGDAAQARKSLGDLLQFSQDPKTQMLTDTARAQMAYQTYERLYVLEMRVGNPADADAALAKVKEYQLKFFKLANASDADTAKAAANLTPERIRSDVDEMDKRQNRRQLPNYAQAVQK